MTRPLAVGSSRVRHYKSCRPCRQSKTKCVGLEESYLRRLDDPKYVPNGPLPRCRRCRQHGVDCTFDPSRRKGRPRRLPRKEDPSTRRPFTSSGNLPPTELPTTLSIHRSPSPITIEEPSRTASPTPSTSKSHSSSDSSKSTPLSSPPRSRRLLPPSTALVKRSSTETTRAKSSPLSVPSTQLVSPQQILESICETYLVGIFPWQPLLPPSMDHLTPCLSTCDPMLLAAINCTVHPFLSAPLFPPFHPKLSVSILQASVLFASRAFGVGENGRATTITAWALAQLRQLGWRGNEVSQLSTSIKRHERSAFVKCGWSIYELAIWLGVLTGNRYLFGIELKLRDEIIPEDLTHQAISLLRSATEFEHLDSLPPRRQLRYSEAVAKRSDKIHKVAVEYLDSSTPAFDPSKHLRPDSLAVASARESAFVSAIISSSCSILLLSRQASHLPFLSLANLGDLTNHHQLPAPIRSAIARGSRQALTIARTTRTRQGKLLALEPHCPSFGSFVLVIAYGILLAADEPLGGDASTNGGEGGSQNVYSTDSRQVKEDLKFCEFVLNHENQKRWPRTDLLRKKLDNMRKTSPVLRKSTTTRLASLLN